MNYLLDTHTFIWFIEGDEELPRKTRNAITNIENKCFISIASLWEIAIKSGNGKLQLKINFHKVADLLTEIDIKLLAIGFADLQTLMSLELIHRDPFDRVIVAQAITNQYTILTRDQIIPSYPVSCFWK